MGLSSLITNAIKTAKTVVDDLILDITLEVRTGDDETEKKAGRRLYAAPVTYRVSIEKKTRFVKIEDGLVAANISAIQFLDPVNIKDRDRITFPDGSQPQIASIEGAMNPSGVYYAPKVYF